MTAKPGYEFEVPGSRLRPGECGKQYELCITLSSKDCCGRVGFIFGTCAECQALARA